MSAISCNVRVLRQKAMAPDIRRLTVALPKEGPLPKAGQFYMLRAWAANESPVLSRPISVHDVDEAEGSLTFLYQIKGEGTQKLAHLAWGQTLTITGPCGNGFDVEAAAKAGKVAGACLGCTCHTKVGPKTVCKDGPVFPAEEVFAL